MSEKHAELFIREMSRSAYVVTLIVSEGCTGLPSYLKGRIRLDIGWNMVVPIKGLSVDSAGISGEFSFNRTPYNVFVPWTAVIGFVSCDVFDSVLKETSSATEQDVKKTISPENNVVQVDFKKKKRT